ncbi:MAG: hypothetical protein O4861_07995 [Trichodesmium sp. St16_bin4-tuft]|nr:hypothetical protein [Trichodesmium sp. St4_bin8_1]MDE5071294.1 hypothetical protein [Trichodesmium sp. St5_bin8]MDE5098277.1 hypothetical protein [Trichodesmium sp. St16_bin4-tuft]MDE5105141.1 hypothetical protein [Trichodesmium sp. St19_bin2]
MPYSKFTLEEVLTNFNLTLVENLGKFNNLPDVAPSKLLEETLEDNIPLAVAIGTEKARSELIVSPILVAVRKHLNKQISLFSGIEFNVNIELGLSGFCDFIISRSSLQTIIKAPVVTLVEAKNDNIKSGFGQCLAEMVAAQIFNKNKGNQISQIYGAITTGTAWQFLELEGENVVLDLEEYSLKNLPKLLGVLISFVS